MPNMRQLARKYAKLIHRVLGGSRELPCTIVGGSFGAQLAYEVAGAACAIGVNVAGLVMQHVESAILGAESSPNQPWCHRALALGGSSHSTAAAAPLGSH